MRFQRFPRCEQPQATPQRIAAARRAVEADREKCGLFPEMMQFKTAEDRVDAILTGRVNYWQEMRDRHAKSWREARQALNQLRPLQRQGLLLYWQTGPYPGSPEYLRSMITQALHGKCWWHQLAERRRLQLIGAGKLPAPWKRKAA